MKLLFITRKVDRRDAVAGFSYGWVSALAQQVSELQVICLEEGDSEGLPTNVHIHSLGKEHGGSRWARFWRLQRLAREIVPEIDAVLAHQNPEFGLALGPWTKFYRKPLAMWYVHKSVTWKLRLLNLFVRSFITASPESFRLETKKKIILHHGIDTELLQFKPRPSSASFSIISVSRISPSKRLETIIDAVSQLKKLLPQINISLTIIGEPVMTEDKKYQRRLEEEVQQRGLEDTVKFIGPVAHQEIAPYFYQADLMVNCSQTGSLDKAVLEAMACGTIVLTTNEAFRSFFKHVGMNLYAENTAALVQKMREIIELPDRSPLQRELRSLIEREHNLKHLSSAIIRHLQSYVRQR